MTHVEIDRLLPTDVLAATEVKIANQEDTEDEETSTFTNKTCHRLTRRLADGNESCHRFQLSMVRFHSFICSTSLIFFHSCKM